MAENNEMRLAVVALMVESEAAAAVNAVLHEVRDFVVGRMGLPYRQRGVNVISVVIDAPAATINALTGKLGMLRGVSAKALFSNK